MPELFATQGQANADESTENVPGFACPRCGASVRTVSPLQVRCPADGLAFDRVDGIWRFLLPERQRHFAEFKRDYETVRQAEGRGSPSRDYYLSLPYRDVSGRFSQNWRIRARSFDVFVKRVLRPAQQGQSRPLEVLDLGAGNGWLSYRLGELGCRAVAIDLLDNELDGLGAHRHYPTPLLCVQAEFDHLPFPPGTFDMVVFNAAFHYSESYETTLQEALRVLRTAGRLVILDSPIYHGRESGVRMVAERQADFQQRFGFPSNSLMSENFLTFARLDELGRTVGLKWRLLRPYYGMRWHLKPLWARLRGGREPAKFRVIVGEREA